jgi:hypothetical protein
MTRRRWIAFHIFVILLIAYVSSYFYISRLRFKQYKGFNLPGFVYVSPESLAGDPESNWRIKDGLRTVFYSPIHQFDEAVFGAPPHVCIDCGIGQKKK